jgi:hypothetical protein
VGYWTNHCCSLGIHMFDYTLHYKEVSVYPFLDFHGSSLFMLILPLGVCTMWVLQGHWCADVS